MTVYSFALSPYYDNIFVNTGMLLKFYFLTVRFDDYQWSFTHHAILFSANGFDLRWMYSKYIVYNFWGAEGAPILFSDLGLRMASCLYIYYIIFLSFCKWRRSLRSLQSFKPSPMTFRRV